MNKFLPPPKQIKYLGDCFVSPDEITLDLPDDNPMLRLAASELVDFLARISGEKIGNEYGKFVIRIGCDNDKSMQKTGFQKYIIRPLENRLELIGEDPTAAYYAVKTLKQAVEYTDGKLKIPKIEISDSADLAERGAWDYFYPCPIRENSEMYTLQTAERWYRFIDDLSDYKINLLELEIGDEGLYYNSKRFPELVAPGTPENKNEIVRDVLAYARQRGIHIFLATWHPEHWSELKSIYPETRGVNPEGCQPSLLENTYCFSHPKTREIYSGIIDELAELFHPEGICVWMPENLGHCTCEKCNSSGHLNAYLSIFEQALSKKPDIRARVLASFMRYSDRVLRQIPKNFELLYYECDRHGMYGFDAEKHLSQYVNDEAKTDRKVLTCINFRGSGQNYVPLPYLKNVKDWIDLLAGEGYYGVNGSMYSNPGVCRMNLLRMADAAWNHRGNNTDEFLRAYCLRNKLHHPEMRSAVLRILSDSWELYHRQYGGIIESHALDWILTPRTGNYVDSVYITDDLEYRDLPALRIVLNDMERGIEMVQKLDDDELTNQFEACKLRLTAMYHILTALLIYSRQLWPDPEKGPWQDWLVSIPEHLQKAKNALEKFAAVTGKITSNWPNVEGEPSRRDEGCIGKIDRILNPEFLNELAEREWSDENSFA